MENTNSIPPHENAYASSNVRSTSACNLFDRLLSCVIQGFQTCLPINATEENVLTSTPNENGNPSYQDYDVFINHRGPDVKATFATYLYRRLVDCGFKVFLDEPEMQAGEPIAGQIKHAIETASIHIAVLSPTYAKSKWCLAELEHMWTMHQSRRSTIIPIFYKVDPFAVRSTSSDYAKALQEQKKRFNDLTIQKWREALKRVSCLGGFELKKFNGDDDELGREVVVHVLERREKRRLKYVAQHEFRTTLESCQAKFVGIVGPAGVGKRTLANEFFQSNKSGYSASCFLFDVKQNTTADSLISMQRKLLKDLTPSDQPMGTIGTIKEGRDKLKMLIFSSKVLIILDNVGHPDQIDAVLPMQDVNGSSSLILVTSRDKNVFERRITEVSIYNLTGLNTVHPRTNLILGGSWLKELPFWLGQLTSLKELWLRDSPNLKKCLSGSSTFQLPYQPGSYKLLNRLERLTIMACGIQTLLPDLVNMNNLTDLRVHDCPLGELSFRKDPGKAILGRESRWLGGAGGSGASQNVCPKLERLWINSCRDLVKVSSLPTTLIRLDFSNCNRLMQIEGLLYLARLEKLDISGCEEVKELQSLDLLECLKELKAFRCSKLESIQGLAGTLKLQIINVRQCHEIKEMPGVERLLSLKTLKTLDVCGCPKMLWGPQVFEQLQQELRDGFLYDSN